MKKFEEKFLPIGTVVKLKDASKRLMIAGYCAFDNKRNTEKMWDYIACLYPEGLISPNRMCFFNHEQIDKIFYYGLKDEEMEKFEIELKKMVEISNDKK